MDIETARTILVGYLGGAGARPVLTGAEVTDLLDRFRVLDGYGLRPGDANWTGTWALNAAAAEGWRMKAARAAGDFDFSADGASYSKAQVMAHCNEMERRFADLDVGVLAIAPPPSDYGTERLWL